MFLDLNQQPDEVSCKWLLSGMAAAILAMGGALLGLAAYIKHLVKKLSECEASKTELLKQQVVDLKENHSLVDTLMNVVTKERKGGP